MNDVSFDTKLSERKKPPGSENSVTMRQNVESLRRVGSWVALDAPATPALSALTPLLAALLDGRAHAVSASAVRQTHHPRSWTTVTPRSKSFWLILRDRAFFRQRAAPPTFATSVRPGPAGLSRVSDGCPEPAKPEDSA